MANKEESDDDELYTHVEYMGRVGESPAEKALREGLNDHGRALEQIQKGNALERKRRAMGAYPLHEDGDEDK